MSEKSPRPQPKPVVHCYVVIDKNDPDPLNPTAIAVGLTRKQCREAITFDPDADSYRIRRLRGTVYEK